MLKEQVEVELQEEVMETSDLVKDKSNDSWFFSQWKMEFFTKCLLAVLKLVSPKLGMIDKL